MSNRLPNDGRKNDKNTINASKIKASNLHQPNKYVEKNNVNVNDKEVTTTVGGDNLYTVKKGDSLSKLSRERGLDWLEVARNNGITTPYTLKVGQKIKF